MIYQLYGNSSKNKKDAKIKPLKRRKKDRTSITLTERQIENGTESPKPDDILQILDDKSLNTSTGGFDQTDRVPE